jgi:hypothetical protein
MPYKSMLLSSTVWFSDLEPSTYEATLRVQQVRRDLVTVSLQPSAQRCVHPILRLCVYSSTFNYASYAS